MAVRSFRGRLMAGLAAGAIAGVSLTLAGTAHANGTSTISGTVFDDANRNGVLDSGETPFANEQLYLYDGAGNYLAATATDASGHYQFTGLADGPYQVSFSYTAWLGIRDSWVPTTTGSLYTQQNVSLAGAAVANIGLRAIVRSTNQAAPITTLRAPSGMVVSSYDDVVSAQDLYNDLQQGTQLGPEAATTTVSFDIGTQTDTTTSVAGSQPCQYANFSANLWVAYDSWLDNRDNVLFHEYGHDWSLYHAYIVQQDPSLASYLQARGLTGNPNLGTSKAWTAKEIFAEDYRQLFGSSTAAAYPQNNSQIPIAANIPGLKTFLQTTYTQSPAGSSCGSGSTAPPPTTPTQPTVAVSNLAMSPQPVAKSGTVSFSIQIPATVTVQIETPSGSVVRTLLSGAGEAAGTVSAAWNRMNSAGKRVSSGSYVAVVTAADAYGHTVSNAVTFTVS